MYDQEVESCDCVSALTMRLSVVMLALRADAAGVECMYLFRDSSNRVFLLFMYVFT